MQLSPNPDLAKGCGAFPPRHATAQITRWRQSSRLDHAGNRLELLTSRAFLYAMDRLDTFRARDWSPADGTVCPAAQIRIFESVRSEA
jgi:hypothetical protein